MENKKNYYAIIPADVRYNKNLTPNAKLLYGELTALSNKEGYCWASNSYFAELYKVSNASVSKWISDLKANNHIKITSMGMRKIFINASRKLDEPLQENLNHNSTVNNTSNNTIKENTPKNLEEVNDYFVLNNSNKEEAYKFFNHFESNGWKVSGRTPMKKWRASANSWIIRSKDFNNKNNSGGAEFPDYYDKKVEWSIGNDSDKLIRYHKHLRSLGWSNINSPTAGTIWKKINNKI